MGVLPDVRRYYGLILHETAVITEMIKYVDSSSNQVKCARRGEPFKTGIESELITPLIRWLVISYRTNMFATDPLIALVLMTSTFSRPLLRVPHINLVSR